MAYQLQDPSAAPVMDTVAVTVADRHFHLYARSFRQAGVNDFRGRRLRTATNGKDACLATGFTANYTVDGLQRPFVGASNHDGCQAAIVAALDVADPCMQASNTTRCTLYGQTMPVVPAQRTLSAHSGFYYTITDFGLTTPVTVMAVATMAEVRAATNRGCLGILQPKGCVAQHLLQELCGLNMSALRNRYPGQDGLYLAVGRHVLVASS